MMYTGDSLRKRLRLRNHATVLAAIDRWWAISRKSISGSGMDADCDSDDLNRFLLDVAMTDAHALMT